MNIAKWGVVLLLAWPAGMAADQQQSAPQTTAQTADQKQDQKQEDPLAAAARRAREQKKQQPKAAKVFDNDSIPKTPGSISVVGESSSATQTAAATGEKAETPMTEAGAQAPGGEKPSGTDEERKAELEKELADAKEHLKTVATDLDILTRKYALDQQTYYGKSGYSSDREGAAALKVEESDIASKKQEVADAQKKVDDLTAKLKELESESAKPASTPQ
jgi:type I restriction-modification system DNA methylase subunit